MYDYSVGTTNTNIFVPQSTPVDTSKTALFFAGRKLNANNQIVVPLNNQPIPSPYVPFKIGSFTDGLSCLTFLKTLGFNYTLGKSYSNTFTPPASVTIDNSTGLVTLTWNDPNNGIQLLVGQQPIGSVSVSYGAGLPSVGTIVSVSVTNTQSTIVVSPITGTIPFTSVGISNVLVNAELKQAIVVDPNNSDDVCVAGFWFFSQQSVVPAYATQPNLILSLYITGRDVSISPVSTPISLVAPTTVTTQPDGSVNLVYPVSVNNGGLLPTTYFGNTLVTQGTASLSVSSVKKLKAEVTTDTTSDVGVNAVTATGTFNGYSLGANNTIIINLVNVTGTFVTTSGVNVVLDISQNGFSFLGKTEVASCGMGYKVTNPITQMVTTGGVYNDYYVGIKALRQPNAYKDNKFNFFGYFAYVQNVVNQYPLNSLVGMDELGFKWTVKWDINGIQQPTINETAIVAQDLYTDLNNQYPYYGTFGESAIYSSPASNGGSTVLNTNQLNQLANQGVNVLGVNTLNQQYTFANICTLQTINSVPTTTNNAMDIQLKVRYLNKNYVSICNSTVVDQYGQRLNNTPALASDLQANLLSFLNLTYGNGKGIVGSNNTVTVTLNPNDNTRFLVNISTSVIPANRGADIYSYFFAYTL